MKDLWGLAGSKFGQEGGLKYGTTITTSSGSFLITKKFRRSVRYSLEFERNNYKITNAWGFSVNFEGPKQKSAWIENFRYADAEPWGMATLVNACTHFDQSASHRRLRTPAAFTNIKIRPKFSVNRTNAVGAAVRHSGVLNWAWFIKNNDVRLFMRSLRRDFTTDELFSDVQHELAHVSHALKDGNHFLLYGGAMIGESYAVAIEWEFMRNKYPARVGMLPDESRRGIETGRWKYTPLFIDVFDNTNQRTINGGTVQFALDAVRIQNWSIIEDIAVGAYGLGQVANRIESKGGVRRQDAEALVEFYQQIQWENGL